MQYRNGLIKGLRFLIKNEINNINEWNLHVCEWTLRKCIFMLMKNAIRTRNLRITLLFCHGIMTSQDVLRRQRPITGCLDSYRPIRRQR